MLSGMVSRRSQPQRLRLFNPCSCPILAGKSLSLSHLHRSHAQISRVYALISLFENISRPDEAAPCELDFKLGSKGKEPKYFF